MTSQLSHSSRVRITTLCHCVPVIIAAATLWPQIASAEFIALTDQTFSDADWSREIISNTFALGTAESTAQQVPDGFPGAFRESQMSAAGGLVGGRMAPRIQIGHFNTAQTWNPMIDGGIDGITLSYHANALDDRPPAQSTPTGRVVRFGFLLRQDGVVFQPSNNSLLSLVPNSGWIFHSDGGKDSSDFRTLTGGPEVLDFSAAGKPIEFGYLLQMSSTSGTGFRIQNTAGIDNFRVGLNFTPVPEPSTSMLLAILGICYYSQRI